MGKITAVAFPVICFYPLIFQGVAHWLRRFREYEAVTSSIRQVDVVTYVVCTANAKVMVSSYKSGINTYRVKIIRLNHHSTDRLFSRIAKFPP